jgi:hypothetical protein
MIPPICPHFQEIMSTASRINEGTRCIRKAPIFCQNVRSGEKASAANKLTKRIARIQRILGVQRRILVDVFILLLLKFLCKLHQFYK